MKPRMFSIFALVLAVSTARADEPAEADLKSLQGTWKPVVLQYEGRDVMPPEIMKRVSAVYENDTYRLFLVDNQGKNVPRMSVRIRLGSADQYGTFQFLNGKNQGVLSGAYELKGDMLRICYRPPNGKKRMDLTFAESAGNECFYEIWKRQAEEKQITANPTPR